MSFEIGKKYFGILHLDVIGMDTPYNIPICLHTRYGNIYITREDKGCQLCVGYIMSCVTDRNVHCSCSLIKKYNKQNKKVLTHFVNDRIKEYNKTYPESDWNLHFNDKLKLLLDSAL